MYATCSTGYELPTHKLASGASRKNIWGPDGPSSFGRQQRLSEITIEPIKNWGAGQDLGGQPKTGTEMSYTNRLCRLAAHV